MSEAGQIWVKDRNLLDGCNLYPGSMAGGKFCDKLATVTPLVIKFNLVHREVGVKINRMLLRLFVCLVALSSFSIAVWADTVRLRDGSVLKGKVVSYDKGKFTILVYIGGKPSQHVLSVEEVESVEFDAVEPVATTRNSSPAPSTDVSRDVAPLSVSKPVVVDKATTDPKETPPAVQSSPAPPAAANDNDAGVIATIAEKSVSVAAGADWTSSEIRVQRGQRIVISAIGEVDLGDNHRSGPDGLNIADKDKLMADRPTGALIAVVGDDNNDFVFVGQSTEFVAKHNGILFLSINEGNLKDNNGAFVARVKVLSNR